MNYLLVIFPSRMITKSCRKQNFFRVLLLSNDRWMWKLVITLQDSKINLSLFLALFIFLAFKVFCGFGGQTSLIVFIIRKNCLKSDTPQLIYDESVELNAHFKYSETPISYISRVFPTFQYEGQTSIYLNLFLDFCYIE